MIDIGANLSNSQFSNDIREVLHSSVRAGLTDIILTSTDIRTYQINHNIIAQHSDVIRLYNTLGLHPHHADNYQVFFKHFDTLIKDPSIISIGELGLDYFRMIASKANQIKTMEIFLEKAKDSMLPLFLHERDAHEDFCFLLHNQSLDNKKVVHCFTGNTNALKRYLDMGCYIGITGWITEEKRGKDLRAALAYLPLDRLMVETDAPYLTPKNIPQKTYRNEPQFLEFVIQKICELKKLSPEVLKKHTYDNTVDFFNLKSYNNTNKLKV